MSVKKVFCGCKIIAKLTKNKFCLIHVDRTDCIYKQKQSRLFVDGTQLNSKRLYLIQNTMMGCKNSYEKENGITG